MFKVHSVQLLSPVWLFATPWTAAYQAFLSIINSRSLLKLMSIELVMPTNHLIHCRPLLLPPSIFPSLRVFSNESILCIRWPKYWSWSSSISPSNEYSGLISFRMEWLDLVVQGTLKRVFSNTTVQKHQFFSAQLSLWSNSRIQTWLLIVYKYWEGFTLNKPVQQKGERKRYVTNAVRTYRKGKAYVLIITMVWSLTYSQMSWNVKSSGP